MCTRAHTHGYFCLRIFFENIFYWSSVMGSSHRISSTIMHVLSWRCVYAITRGLLEKKTLSWAHGQFVASSHTLLCGICDFIWTSHAALHLTYIQIDIPLRVCRLLFGIYTNVATEYINMKFDKKSLHYANYKIHQTGPFDTDWTLIASMSMHGAV